jgi:SAM-dependent methyltransferase
MINFPERLTSDYYFLQAKQKTLQSRHASISRLQRLLYPHLPARCLEALDLGAGQGELVHALTRLGCTQVIGVEQSPSQVSAALRHGSHGVVQCDALSYLTQQPDASHDLITCFDVLEHLSISECERWFREIFRILRPGGRLIGHVPNGLNPFVGSVYLADLTHVWCPVPESIRVFCRASGFVWHGAFDNIGASQGFSGFLRTFCWQFSRLIYATFTTLETGANGFCLPWSRTFLFVAERPSS